VRHATTIRWHCHADQVNLIQNNTMRHGLYFLSSLRDADIDWLVAAGHRREVAVGVNLIEESRPIDSLFLVIDGAFSVRTAGPDGHRTTRLLPGDIVGEMSLVDSAPPPAMVRAVEDSVVLAIPHRRLHTRLTEDPGFASRFYRALSMLLADRLRAAIASAAGAVPLDEDGELPVEAMDDVGVALARFDWIQQRLRLA
jgi:CRP/FNR family transcriptional regulator, cyclic AMP receptor protein